MQQSIQTEKVLQTTRQRPLRRVASPLAKRHKVSARAEFVSHLRYVGMARVPEIGICVDRFLLRRADAMNGCRSCISSHRRQGFHHSFADQQLVADSLLVASENRTACAGGVGAAAFVWYLIEHRHGRTTARNATQLSSSGRVNHARGVRPSLTITECATELQMRRVFLSGDHDLTRTAAVAEFASGLGVSVRERERNSLSHLGTGLATHYCRLCMGFTSWPTGSTDGSPMNISIEAGFSDGTRVSRQSKGICGFSLHLPPAERVHECEHQRSARAGISLPATEVQGPTMPVADSADHTKL